MEIGGLIILLKSHLFISGTNGFSVIFSALISLKLRKSFL